MSSPDAVTLRVHRFSLSQIGPDLEDQVAAALAQVAEAFSDPESYEGDVLKGKVTVTLDLDYHVKNRGTLARGLVACAPRLRNTTLSSLFEKLARFGTPGDRERSVQRNRGMSFGTHSRRALCRSNTATHHQWRPC